MTRDWRQSLAFGLGAAAASWPHTLIAVYLLFFLTEHAGINPALAGLVLAAPRIWDMAMDIPVGRLSDRCALGPGGRRRLVLWSAIALSSLLPLTFYLPPTDSLWLRAAFFTVVGMAHASAFSAFSVSYMVLADENAAGHRRRNVLIAAAAICTVAFNVALTALAPKLIALGGDGPDGYLFMSLALLPPALLFFGLGYRAVGREAGTAPPTPAPRHERLLPQLRGTFGNRAFWMLIGILLCHTLGMGCLNALGIYANKYLLERQAEDLVALLSPIAVAALVGMPLAVPLANRLGAATAIRLGLGVQALGLFLLWLAMVKLPALLIPAGALAGLSTGALTLWLMGAVLDLCKSEGDPVPKGVYLGIYYAVQKLGQSAGGLLASGGLALIGIGSGTPSTPELRLDLAVLTLIGPFAPLLLGFWLALRMPWPRPSSSPTDSAPPAAGATTRP